MKRFIIIIMATIAFAAQQPIMSQSHRATPRTAATAASDTAGIEAFSDTTGGTTGTVMPDTSLATNTYHHTYSVTMNPDDMDQAFSLLDTMCESMAGSMVFALLVLLIIFVIAPLAVLFLIFYFIYKYRKQKLQLAETAMKNGQPIPETITPKAKNTDEDTWAKGVKKVALGAGLIACCWILDFDLGIAAGYIFFFYGLGLMFIAKTTSKKEPDTTLTQSEEDSNDQNENN
jgi:hypothetical protein